MTSQLQMFDPRATPTATAVMLQDVALRVAIADMRHRTREGARRHDDAWPYVEHLCEIEGRPAWLVDDDGRRYVVVNGFVWLPDELTMAAPKLREAAWAALERLKEFEQGEAA